MSDRQNVLLIFTDQQRFDTIHALGNSVIKTPNLDRLCREGTAFTSCYSPCPVCVPARAAMHYGRWAVNSGCYDNCNPMPDTKSFMDILSSAGYRTHGVGKCHFNPDLYALRGFQSREIQEEVTLCHKTMDTAQDYSKFLFDSGIDSPMEPHGVRGEMYYIPQVSGMSQDNHPTNWVGDRSVNFINQQKDNETPWLLFSSYIHPHPPFCPPSPWYKLYRPDLMPDAKIPEDYEFLQTGINRLQNRYKHRDSGWNRHLIRCLKAYYYACISFVDYQVGKILTALEDTAQLDNTLIIFSSDHGELLGDYRSFGKRSMHDSCARIPMIVRQSGRIAAGETCDTPVSLVDIAPTIFASAGVDSPEMKLDGVDLEKICSGSDERDTVYSQFGCEANGIYTAVNSKWKYAFSAADNREYLFDRKNDPLELRSVASHAFNREALAEMRGKTQRWVSSGEDKNNASAALEEGEWKVYQQNSGLLADPDACKILQDPRGYEKCMQDRIGSDYL